MKNAVRLPVALALIAAGLLSVVAAYDRWWPECRPGQFWSDACVRIQDHSFDTLSGEAAAGGMTRADISQVLCYLLLGVAILLIAKTLPGLWWNVALGSVGVANLVIGVWALVTRMGGDLPIFELPLQVSFIVLTMFAPILLVVAMWPLERAVDRWVLGFIALTTPLIDYLITPTFVGGSSHDSHPWTGATSGWFLVLAGLICAFGLRSSRRRSIVRSEEGAQPEGAAL